MKTSVSAIPTAPDAIRDSRDPSVWTVAFIFWFAFAAAVTATAFLNPQMFDRHDPDSFLRLVQVRDLLGGQAWFDLVQTRIDPPNGVLMHWSRLIDAPIAALVVLGNLFGDGERFALLVWPLMLLLVLMSANVSVATTLAGRAAALPVLVLSLLFFSPLLTYLPNDIDHHNAQVALLAATLAALMQSVSRPSLGAAAGLGCAVMLAIGLEMLPYIAVLGVFVALRWAITGEGGRGAALFGATFAAAPAALHIAAGSPAAAVACDSLSWAYATPAAVAGAGLAATTFWLRAGSNALFRLSALGVVAVATAGAFAAVSPDCLAGPFGALSPELKRLWLYTVTEAQPLLKYAVREPVGAAATFGPPAVALLVALGRIRRGPSGARWAWAPPAAIIATALALSFYQVRTLPVANAFAIPVLGAWLAELAARHGVVSLRPMRRALPVFAAFLATMPLVHLAVGWTAVRAVSAITGGRIARVERPDAPDTVVATLSKAERDCDDPASAALLASAPEGLVLAPIFYAASVLALSDHAVLGAPYHRGGAAILDTIRALGLPPERALPIVEARAVDYVAICSPAQESAIAMAESRDSLWSVLHAGAAVPWLEEVPAAEATGLRLWRVVR